MLLKERVGLIISQIKLNIHKILFVVYYYLFSTTIAIIFIIKQPDNCNNLKKNREENTKGKTAWMRKSINKAMFVQSRLFHTTLVCRQARQ